MQRHIPAVLVLIAAALPAGAQAAAQAAPDILALASRGAPAQVRQALQAGSDAETKGEHGITP